MLNLKSFSILLLLVQATANDTFTDWKPKYPSYVGGYYISMDEGETGYHRQMVISYSCVGLTAVIIHFEDLGAEPKYEIIKGIRYDDTKNEFIAKGKDIWKPLMWYDSHSKKTYKMLDMDGYRVIGPESVNE